MSETKKQPGSNIDYEIFDYFCDRARLQLEETRRPGAPCLKQHRMKDISAVEALSHQLQQEYGFNLVHVSTKAALRYMHIDSSRNPDANKRELKRAVLKRLEHSLKTSTDPITGGPLGRLGITEPMVLDLIELEKTGNIVPKPIPKVPLTTRDIDLLDVMRSRALASSKTAGEKEAIVSLYQKIRGFPPKATA
jgi:hypothetical protein